MRSRMLAILSIVLFALLAALIGPLPTEAGGGGGCHAPASSGAGQGVEIKDLCFSPTVLEVEPGDQVTWTNTETIPHTVTGSNLTWGGHASMELDDSATYAFNTPGVYPYYCAFHPGMVGAVVVRSPGDAPPAPATGDQGATSSSSDIPRFAYAAFGALAGIVAAGAGFRVIKGR